VDPQVTFTAIRRFAPSAAQVIVIAPQPTRQFAWRASADVNDAENREQEELRAAAQRAAAVVDVVFAPELTADALSDAVTAGAIDLVVVGSPQMRALGLVAEVRKRTQRGNGGQFILATDSERMVYLDLLGQAVKLHGAAVVGYCLMWNHMHGVVVPHQAEALAETFKQVHGGYASYWNVVHAGSRHVRQGRFYSCPLDAGHLWVALRYAERNPVGRGWWWGRRIGLGPAPLISVLSSQF
jgi:REP element-mobilizing transposase RayT